MDERDIVRVGHYDVKDVSKMHQVRQILFVTGSLYNRESGTFLSVKESAEAIVKYSSQYAVTLVGTIDGSESLQPDWYEAIDCVGFKRFGPRNFHISPSAVWWLRWNVSSFDFVVIHSLWSYLHLEAARLAHSANVPYMFVVHGNLNPRAIKFSNLRKKIASSIYGDVLEAASCYQALNNEEREVIRRFGIRNPIAVIPNGVNPLKVREESKKDLNKKNKRMLYLGRINPIKGLDQLLACWATLPKLWDQWEFIIVGDDSGAYAKKLKKKYSTCIRSGQVRFVGPMYGEEKFRMLMESDLFVLPSRSEGMPMTVLEAASIGLPCAITENCGLQDMVKQGGAFLIGAGPDEMLRDLLYILTKSPEKRQRVGMKGREYVKEHHSWRRVVAMYDELFKCLLNGGDKPAWVKLS